MSMFMPWGNQEKSQKYGIGDVEDQRRTPLLTEDSLTQGKLQGKPLLAVDGDSDSSSDFQQIQQQEADSKKQVEKYLDAWEAAMCERLSALEGHDARTRSPDPVWAKDVEGQMGQKCLSHPGEVLAARAAAQPHRNAVEFWPEYDQETYTWRATYSEFLRDVQVFACKVNSSPVPLSCNNSIAVLYMERGPESVIGMWGCFYAGVAVTAVDYTYPLERLRFTLEDTAAKVLLLRTAREASDWIGNANRINDQPPVVPDSCAVWGMRDILDNYPLDQVWAVPPAKRSDSELCAVIYTSGSTGKPKGVELLLGGFSNYCCIDQHLIDMQPTDRTLQTQSLSFVSGFMETFRPLIAGATLVVAGTDIAHSGEDLFPWMDNAGITFFKCVPSLLRAVLGVEELPAVPRKLRVLLASGEALSQDLVQRIYLGAHANRSANMPGLIMLNTYGPTELNANCSASVTKLLDEKTSIGTPYPTYKLYCLDDKNQVSTKGELCVSGLSLAKGYLGRKEATDAAFFEHPELGRLYRTGDLATKAPDGKFYYAGRIGGSAQIKINGYRVELGEVEQALRKLPEVAETIVVFTDNQLVAVVKNRPGPMLKVQEMREALFQGGLPPHSQPSRLLLVKEVPTTISGKLDRNAAAALVKAETKNNVEAKEAKSAAAPPKCEIERVVRTCMAEVLGLNTGCKAWSAVTEEDDFFTLGGSSVTAGKLVSALRRADAQFSVVSVRTLYANSTAAGLVKIVNEKAKAKVNKVTPQENAPSLMQAVPDEIQGKSYPKMFQMCQLLYILVLVTLKAAKLSMLWAVCSVGAPVEFVTASFAWMSSKIIVGILFLSTAAVVGFTILEFFSVMYLILLKTIVVGKYKEGRFALYGKRHLQHWMVEQTSRMLVMWTYMSPNVLNTALWLLGARVSKDAKLIGVELTHSWDLIEIGKYASVCHCFLTPVSYEKNAVLFGRVSIGENAVLRPCCNVVGPAQVEEGAVLDFMSTLYSGKIPAHEVWKGSPARKEDIVPKEAQSVEGWPLPFYKYILFCLKCTTLFVLALLLKIPSVAIFFMFPDLKGLARWTVIFPVTAVLAVPVETLLSTVICRLAKGGVKKTGRFNWRSFAALRAEFTMWAFAIPMEALNNTSLLCTFMRWAGVRLGKEANMAQLKGAVPALVDIGPRCTFANWVHCGLSLFERGNIDLTEFHVGHDTLLGNRCMIPPGAFIPPESVGGVLSVPPSQYVKQDEMPDLNHMEKIMYMGNPPIRLREVAHGARPVPTTWQKYRREVADWVVVFVPSVIAVAPKIAWLLLFVNSGLDSEIVDKGEQILACTSFSFLTPLVLFYMAAHLIVPFILAKVARMARGGPIVPGEHGFWSFYVDRWHLGNKIMTLCVNKELLTPLANSRWLSRMLRLISDAKVHPTALLNGEGMFRDLDVIQIGPNAVVNEQVVFRTHTFENWTLQFDTVTIEKDAVVGVGSELMPGCILREGCDVKHLTFVNKGEEVPKYSQFAGLPGEVVSEMYQVLP
eukprot:gnl/MRDRNA2_/MRDRNA2_72773_c0_seq1.p1 gnl/MRDRNA2_/MRDRNA2_72773_c0~~gnl/MRDRNA2_/MRDRNA2_72773_c0_seq1.p1  ORF type:complete len:1505 (-),score=298.08 gnl/MRDRNA2_/MRDRNA2_72773_c0_seq1:185-4699(-)